MSGPISAERAWEIARGFALESTKEDVDGCILAIFMIGSLATGQYHPGRSDIDTVIITSDSIPEGLREKLGELRRVYVSKYNIPKGFGGIILREQDLNPPYDPEKELVPEIYRLLEQGKPIWGEYDVSNIPTPSRNDIRAYAKVFYTWCSWGAGPNVEETTDMTGKTGIGLDVLTWFPPRRCGRNYDISFQYSRLRLTNREWFRGKDHMGSHIFDRQLRRSSVNARPRGATPSGSCRFCRVHKHLCHLRPSLPVLCLEALSPVFERSRGVASA